ncbi:MAG: hypothetical protein LBJ77_01820 [Holosporales bacterium]|jgi:hypothetical protein|nr:hypothetical protein [Holosporales bacterium]
MDKFQLNLRNSRENFVTDDVTGISTSEIENEIPKCIVDLPTTILDSPENFEVGEVLWGDRVLFRGRLSSCFSTDRKSLQIELHASGDDQKKISTQSPEATYHDMLEKFRADNPDVAIPLTIDQVSRIGDIQSYSIIIPESEPINLDDKIFLDSFKKMNYDEKAVGDVSLEITASWVARREGDLELSSRIANRFSGGKINSLTPKNLQHSWPDFGDRVSRHRNSRATKYFVGHSRLTRDPSMATFTPEISISDDIPPFRLRREFFDNNLTLSWGFNQFTTETFRANIRNNDHHLTKHLKINLHNVQEYVENPMIDHFFSTDIGSSILREIVSGIGSYMALSMRNIEFSFEIPFNEEALQIGCDTWIQIQNYLAKVTKVEFKITNQERIVKIKAAAFSEHERLREKMKERILLLQPPEIPRNEDAGFGVADILHDIAIQNDAETQFSKLMAYIADLKRDNKINKRNYKSLISSFLNENQTKITIITKPLKTQHHEKKLIEISDPIIF